MLDRIGRKLSYSLYLLIGLVCLVSLPVDHSGWFATKCRMLTHMIAEVDPFPNAYLRL